MLRGDLACGQDVEIDVGCVFEGSVTLADGVRIGPHCVIANARIEAGAVIHAFTHIDGGGQGVLEPDSGHVRRGANLEVAYFDQMRAALDMDATLEDFISPGSEWIEIGQRRQHVKSYLGDFLFSPARAASPPGNTPSTTTAPPASTRSTSPSSGIHHGRSNA